MWFIDFETRSELDIKKTGARKYAMDKSTSTICLAYGTDDDPVIKLCTKVHAVCRR